VSPPILSEFRSDSPGDNVPRSFLPILAGKIPTFRTNPSVTSVRVRIGACVIPVRSIIGAVCTRTRRATAATCPAKSIVFADAA